MFKYDRTNKFYYSTLFDARRFLTGFGTKEFNREFLKGQSVVNLWQVHRDGIAFVASNIKEIPDADAAVTTKENLILTVKTADCVPIIFADPKKKLVGISHDGWRGTLLNLSKKMIDFFVSHGSSVSDIIVAIGPSIGDCCYNISAERLNLFKKTFPEFNNEYFEEREGEIFLNLMKLNYLQLVASGVKRSHIDFFPFCTKCNSERFYSSRRGDSKNRMISFVMTKS